MRTRTVLMNRYSKLHGIWHYFVWFQGRLYHYIPYVFMKLGCEQFHYPAGTDWDISKGKSLSKNISKDILDICMFFRFVATVRGRPTYVWDSQVSINIWPRSVSEQGMAGCWVALPSHNSILGFSACSLYVKSSQVYL